MKLNAQIQWLYDGNCEKMTAHLRPYLGKRVNILKTLFGASSQEFEEITELCIRCGSVPGRSYFAFLQGTGKSTLIHGFCPSQRLDHLLEDFDFLLSQMQNTDLQFYTRDVHIRLNDEKLVKKTLSMHFTKKSVIVELFSMTGGVSLISSFLLNKPILEFVPIAIIGFFLWVAVSYIGYWSESEYVLQ